MRLGFAFFIAFLYLSSLCKTTATAQDSGKSVFSLNRGNNSKWILFRNNSSALYNILSRESFRLLDKREQKITHLTSEKDWMKYRDSLRNRLFSSLGRFEKTPLNSKITGTIRREGLTVEKVVFESHPHFYVTGCLFLPVKREKPAPAIVYCSGHSENGFRSEAYQRVIMNLVDKGFIVFSFDPIGQGERLQYADPETGKSKIGGPTTEHSYAGAQTLLCGFSLSDYFIWDGVRAVDYLLTRPEVDPERIGITGRSGGGTQTAMIAAFDQRITAAAPECYITSFRRLLQSAGPPDAEQNMYGAIAREFDFPDYFHLRAPKPSLIITTTHDFFPIQGARETFREAQKSYTAFGKPADIRMTEAAGGHESTRANREALYAFFRQFLHLPGDTIDREISPFTEKELRVTPTGQVGTSFQGETVFSLNRKYFRENIPQSHGLKESVMKISGIRFKKELSNFVFTGRFSGNGSSVEKYFLENNTDDFALPLYVMPNESRAYDRVLVWLHPGGKEKILEESWLRSFLESGFCVVAADLPGTGELADAGFRGDGFVNGVPFNYTFGLNLTGNSVPGIQAEWLDWVIQFIEKDPRLRGKPRYAMAQGTMCSSLLHYATFRNSFSGVALVGMPPSPREFLNVAYYDPGLLYGIVPGSLGYYDFQDLIGLLPPGSCRVFNPVNAINERTGKESTIADILGFLKMN